MKLDFLGGWNEPAYIYKVLEFVTTFEKDSDKSKPFSAEEIFRDKDLLTARSKALLYFRNRLEGFMNGNVKFHLPFEGYQNFKYGKNAAYSINLILEDTSNEIEYIILGDDDEMTNEGREIEKDLFPGVVLEY